MIDWLTDSNAQWVLAGSVFLGISGGVLGCFALLRRRSLLGDAIAHAALPGICIAFLLTGTRALAPLLVGALIAGLVGAACIHLITRHTKLKEDATLGVVLSVFFAFGIVLLTLIQHSGAGSQAGLDKYLFGQAASMVGNDVRVLAICAVVICLITAFLYKEFKLLCFDRNFAAGAGFSPDKLDGLLMILLVLAIVVGMQAMGVVLMAAMLIIPAAAARLWTDRLVTMIVLSGIFGAIAGAGGTAASGLALRMPTGPLIVLSCTTIFILSFLLAPHSGLLGRTIRVIKLRARVSRENVLRSFYEVLETDGPWNREVRAEEIADRRGAPVAPLRRKLEKFMREGLVSRGQGGYRLSERGLEAAHGVIRNHRLWEMFLMYEGQLGVDHVDRDADYIEHYLPEETVTELERFLEVHGLEPKLLPDIAPGHATPD